MSWLGYGLAGMNTFIKIKSCLLGSDKYYTLLVLHLTILHFEHGEWIIGFYWFSPVKVGMFQRSLALIVFQNHFWRFLMVILIDM